MQEKKLSVDWEIFFKRISKEYPIASYYMHEMMLNMEDLWNQVNPRVGNSGEFKISYDEENRIKSTQFTLALLGKLAEIIHNVVLDKVISKEELKNLENSLILKSKNIAEETAKKIASEGLIFEAELNQMRCKECGFLNSPDHNFCCNCGNELDKEE